MKKEEPSNNIDASQEKNFEMAFARLEEILERMNSGNISLDESLKLYEEADSLINLCGKRLNDAERRIEILIKNRGGELSLSPDLKPLTQDFNPSSSQSFGTK